MVPKNIRIVKKASEKAKVFSEAFFVSEKRRKSTLFASFGKINMAAKRGEMKSSYRRRSNIIRSFVKNGKDNAVLGQQLLGGAIGRKNLCNGGGAFGPVHKTGHLVVLPAGERFPSVKLG